MKDILKGYKFERKKIFYNKKNIFILILCFILSFGVIFSFTYSTYTYNNQGNINFDEKTEEYYKTQKEYYYYCYNIALGNEVDVPEDIVIPSNISKEDSTKYYNEYLMYDHFLKTKTTYYNYSFFDYRGNPTSLDTTLIYLDVIFVITIITSFVFTYLSTKEEEKMNYLKNVQMSKLDLKKFILGKNLFKLTFILSFVIFYFLIGFIFYTPKDIMLKNNEFITMNFKWFYLIKFVEIFLSIIVYDIVLFLVSKRVKSFKKYFLINIIFITLLVGLYLILNLIFVPTDYFNITEYMIIISLFNFYPMHFYLIIGRIITLFTLIILYCFLQYFLQRKKMNKIS